MEPLPVIPTPPGQKFREFRIRFLPAMVFSATVLAIAFLWSGYVSPPTLVAQAEAVTAEVKSLDDGVITNLFVERYQLVKKGDPVAAVVSRDNRRLDAQLQILRGQISLAQLQLGTLVDRDRLAFDYQGLRSEYFRQRSELEMAKAELPHAEFDVNQAKKLTADKVLSEFDYRRFLSVFESLQAKATQLSNHVAELEERLQATLSIGQFSSETETGDAVRQAIANLEAEGKKLEQISSEPIIIASPLDGIVTAIHRRAGEALLAGEPIVTISSTESSRIVGYLRQPISIQPEPGMAVRVATRSFRRLEVESTIMGVGAQFEVITNFALLHPSVPFDMGLPLAIVIPPELQAQLRPGELVDVIIHRP